MTALVKALVVRMISVLPSWSWDAASAMVRKLWPRFRHA